MFIFPDKTEDRYITAMTDYCICACLSIIVIAFVLYGIYLLVRKREGKGRPLFEVIKCGLLYLPVMLAALAIKLPGGYLTNDEYSIFNSATNLIHDTWFNYMTVYYYIVSIMLIPLQYGPIIAKVIIEFFVVGYCVYRTKQYYGRRAGTGMYILFLLYPVIAYTTSAHRLPVYFLIYLAVFTKLLFDYLEKKNPDGSIVFVIVAGAVLTQWRTEGIYLLILIPILLLIVYPPLRKTQKVITLIAAYFLVQYILWIPQNGALSSNLNGAANDRMKPFYAYTITNMYRNGLDTEKNAADLAIVDRYLSLDAIKAINDHYGDINYEDVLILYADGFVGVREDAGDKEFYEYSEALKRIFINNPGVFIRTRWGAFCYAATPYGIVFPGGGIRGFVSFAVSLVKTITYNLFIPVLFALGSLIFSLIRRKWYSFFVFGGLMAHWFIVFILAPASYFKYYFPIYIVSYFYAILILIRLILCKDKDKLYPVV